MPVAHHPTARHRRQYEMHWIHQCCIAYVENMIIESLAWIALIAEPLYVSAIPCKICAMYWMNALTAFAEYTLRLAS